MKRRMLMSGLVLGNLVLALALWAQPAATQSGPDALFNCCEATTGGGEICCYRCCWIIQNCDRDEDCNDA